MPDEDDNDGVNTTGPVPSEPRQPPAAWPAPIITNPREGNWPGPEE